MNQRVKYLTSYHKEDNPLEGIQKMELKKIFSKTLPKIEGSETGL